MSIEEGLSAWRSRAGATLVIRSFQAAARAPAQGPAIAREYRTHSALLLRASHLGLFVITFALASSCYYGFAAPYCFIEFTAALEEASEKALSPFRAASKNERKL
jgi:hypothetical protein